MLIEITTTDPRKMIFLFLLSPTAGDLLDINIFLLKSKLRICEHKLEKTGQNEFWKWLSSFPVKLLLFSIVTCELMNVECP